MIKTHEKYAVISIYVITGLYADNTEQVANQAPP
jgi:hydroxymethylpyrimidine/phosphomethylpyrimidine kinase